MLIRFITGILFAATVAAIGRGIVAAFDLDAWVASMIEAALHSAPIGVVAWVLSGALGMAALVAWVGLRIDEVITDFFAPRPPLGSLHFEDGVLRVHHEVRTSRTSVEMNVKLRNSNSELVRYGCELRATVNNKNLDRPVIFDGYANAGQSTTLVLNMEDIPTDPDVSPIIARMSYDLSYRFATGKRARRTYKLIEFRTTMQTSGVAPGTQREFPITVRFFDEIEE